MIQRTFLEYKDTYCLRGIAMLMIIIGHTYNGYPLDNPHFYFPSWLNYLQLGYWGGMGVGIFLFLSGYGLSCTLSNKTTIDKRYIISKIERLLKPFVIYWIVEIVVLAIFNREELTIHLLREIITFSIHPNVENWFFKVIVIIYVITILLFRLRIKNSYRLFLFFILSIAYLFIMRELGYGQWWYNNILAYPLGALVYYKYDWFSKQNSILMIVSGFCLMFIMFHFHMNTFVLHLSFILFCIYSIRFVNIQNRILFFIGYNSFVFYFLECPIMDEVMMFCYSCFPLYCILTVLGTYVLSFICIRCSRLTQCRLLKL